MDIFAFSLAAVSGICLGTGIFHLFIGLRRQGTDMKHFTFGLFAVAYSGAVLTGLLMYRAATLPQYLAVDRWNGVFIGVTYIFLIWFVAVYTDVQLMPVLAGLTALFATVIAAHVTRSTLIHGEIMGLASATLPWGEQITFLEAAESTWEIIFLLTQLLTIGFLFYASIRQYRRGERRAAVALGAGLLFFVATIIFDMFVESGIINFVIASDFGFLGLAIVMSLKMSNDIIRTEEEVTRYRGQLETLVQERTYELQQANDQLAHEVGERGQAEKTLRRHVEELAVLSRITQLLATVTDLPLALEQVGEAIVHLFDARYTYVILPSAKDPQLQVLVGFERESGPIGAVPLPVSLDETPYFRRVLDHAESLTITDVQALPLAAPMRDSIASQQIQNAMLVPLMVRGAAIGLLAIATDRDDFTFTADQVRLAETVAGDMAGAIENARLFERAQAVAVSEERSRLARELHDSVTQILFSINLIALSLGRLWKRNPERAARTTDELQRLTHGALAEMRTLLRELRPQIIAATELGTLLKQLSDGVSARHDIPVDVEVGTLCEIPQEVHVALYRIAQEALTNITKHAEASQVAVKLVCEDTAVQLAITDDGQGFDPDDVPAEHMGLDIMRERADAIGAEIEIDSRPGTGTSITITWPIPQTGGDRHAKS
jgi:signal transduction histidine kinase